VEQHAIRREEREKKEEAVEVKDMKPQPATESHTTVPEHQSAPHVVPKKTTETAVEPVKHVTVEQSHPVVKVVDPQESHVVESSAVQKQDTAVAAKPALDADNLREQASEEMASLTVSMLFQITSSECYNAALTIRNGKPHGEYVVSNHII
jgi:hypothetical protein